MKNWSINDVVTTVTGILIACMVGVSALGYHAPRRDPENKHAKSHAQQKTALVQAAASAADWLRGSAGGLAERIGIFKLGQLQLQAQAQAHMPLPAGAVRQQPHAGIALATPA